MTLSNGTQLELKDLGAASATIQFYEDNRIVFNINMLDGNVISTNAVINEIKIDGNTGYLIAQWPDMTYPVKQNFSIAGDLFEYQTKFENPTDQLRYGSVETAVLRRIK